MAKRGKKYRDGEAKIEKGRAYAPKTAMTLLKEISAANYDPTVDVSFRLGVDPRKADQMVRGAVSLPHGTGKTAVIAVVAGGEKAQEATSAGADHVGGDDLIERLSNGELIDELDAIVATPDQMGKLGRLGKVLGPRGLMPNPKSGTVTMDVAKAVSDIKGGQVEYRTDRNGNVHTILGKASFTAEQLAENFLALNEELLRQRPASAKGKYMVSATISTSASPGIKVDAVTKDEE